MKKSIYYIMTAVFSCTVWLAGCSTKTAIETNATEAVEVSAAETATIESNETEPQEAGYQKTENQTVESKQSENVLIAYFGRRGNTDFPEDVDATTSASIVVGNDGSLQGTTEYVASLIQSYTGGDMHLIQTAEPYPADYDATVDQNHQEQADEVVPELTETVADMEQYETIYIGYPIWATTLPQPVVSFLNQYDFSGKTVIPFCTHAGYGSGNSYDEIRSLCQGAQVMEGLAIEAENIQSAGENVQQWLEDLGITEETDTGSVEMTIELAE